MALVAVGQVVLATPAAADGPVDGGRVLLSVCPDGKCGGVHVYLDSASNHFGSDGYSFCTRDETSTDFPLAKDGEAHSLYMVEKNEGSCYGRDSYNTWIVAAYRDGKLLGHRLVWIGQDVPLGLSSFYAKCLDRNPWPAGEPVLTCARDTSYGASPLILKVGLPPPPGPPACSSAGDACHLSIHVDSPVCVSFLQETQDCKGSSDGTPGWVEKYGVTHFSWTTRDRHKNVEYSVASGGAPFAKVVGSVPDAGSADLNVSEAYSTAGAFPGSRWHTGTTGKAGQRGGPLFIDFHAGTVGADIYIHGWLERRP